MYIEHDSPIEAHPAEAFARPLCPRCRSEHVRVTHTSRPVRYMTCHRCETRFKVVVTYTCHWTPKGEAAAPEGRRNP